MHTIYNLHINIPPLPVAATTISLFCSHTNIYCCYCCLGYCSFDCALQLYLLLLLLLLQQRHHVMLLLSNTHSNTGFPHPYPSCVVVVLPQLLLPVVVFFFMFCFYGVYCSPSLPDPVSAGASQLVVRLVCQLFGRFVGRFFQSQPSSANVLSICARFLSHYQLADIHALPGMPFIVIQLILKYICYTFQSSNVQLKSLYIAIY